MVVPVDAEKREAEKVHRKLGQCAGQGREICARRRSQLEHHDGDDPITERFESSLGHSSGPRATVRCQRRQSSSKNSEPASDVRSVELMHADVYA